MAAFAEMRRVEDLAHFRRAVGGFDNIGRPAKLMVKKGQVDEL